MIDGVIGGRSADRANQRIGRIGAQRDLGRVFIPSQVLRHGFADDGRQGLTAPLGPVLQLAIAVLREPQIGRDILRHRGTTIS